MKVVKEIAEFRSSIFLELLDAQPLGAHEGKEPLLAFVQGGAFVEQSGESGNTIGYYATRDKAIRSPYKLIC